MKIKKKNLQIAIDGPSGTGKSTLALALAKRLGIKYLYTGALYRAVTYLVLKNNTKLSNKEKIINLIQEKKIRLKESKRKDRHTDVYLNGENITSYLFKRRVSQFVPKVAKIRGVRDYVNNLIKEMVAKNSVVMDGRDIGTVVLPKADLKIYLTASLRERAERRTRQLEKIGKPQPFEKIVEQISLRDRIDMNRKESPLKPAKDAWILDTTGLTIEEEIEKVLQKLKEKNLIE